MKRGPKPTPHITTGMYMQYWNGLSTAEVAAAWGVTPATVRRRFDQMGLPLRSRLMRCKCRAPRSGTNTGEYGGRRKNCATYNRRRTEVNGAAQVAKTMAALDLFAEVPPTDAADAARRELHYPALITRVTYDYETLAEVAASVGMTKDAYWSKLRRALTYAERLENRRTA